MSNEFDLTPDPRVLQILGEINLEQWKCLAELIDNSIDAFINARRSGNVLEDPEVAIALPTADREDASVTVRDNGPGMTIEQLESAVRAGWTGNNPLDNLGLFGMGFNIATARLGTVTEVYTTRASESEWTGLRIDLHELRRTRSYHTPRLTKPKADSRLHGTEIRILRLKSDQRAFFAKNANHQRIRRQLSRTYAPLLLSKDGSFSLQMNGQAVQPKRHCYWEPERFVQINDGTPVHAVEAFDYKLPARKYCLTCMTSFIGDAQCPTQTPACRVIEVQRRLHGWLGIQRYVHEEDFGIDLIRNGRVIESQNKDLFVWSGGERLEREYPIDDPRNRGRFIGEIHLDHCRVSYTKDRFERDDPAWQEMTALIRGEGPLQPQKAKSLGFSGQTATLYRLFQAFRRSQPQGKSGRWAKILAVKNNERAVEMAEYFHRGDPEYQTDEKWFALIEEEDRSLVAGPLPATGGQTSPPPEIPAGFLDDEPPASGKPSAQAVSVASQGATASPRTKLHELSRTYKHPLLKVEFNVEAFVCGKNDPDVPLRTPWVLKLDDPGTGAFLFLFDKDHPVFRSVTMTPIDALLCELAAKAYEFLSDINPTAAVFATILADLRQEYAIDSRLDAKDLIAQADATLREIGVSIARTVESQKFLDLFNSLPDLVQDNVRRKIASAGTQSLQAVIASGEFLSYARPEAICQVVREKPELFFDGRFWDQPYVTLDYGSAQVNEEARKIVLERYESYLSDAVWLGTQSPRDIERSDRDEVIRASLSLRLLRPDRVL